MRLPFFPRRDPQAAVRRAARELALSGVARKRALIRATTDAMAARMGLPKIDWPKS